MPGTPDDAQILEGVRACLAQVMDLPVAEVTPESRLMADLGAESIDLIDIGYQLECKFGIKIMAEDLFDPDFFRMRLLEGERELTAEEAARFRDRYPFLAVRVGDRPTVAAVADRYTVAAISAFVVGRLRGEAAAGVDEARPGPPAAAGAGGPDTAP